MYFYFSHLTRTFHLNCCLNKIFVIVIVIVIVNFRNLVHVCFAAYLKMGVQIFLKSERKEVERKEKKKTVVGEGV